MNDTYFATPANSNATILVDEIGIEIGVFGDYRLKTAYRPVFRRLDGMQVEPFAVEGSLVPFLRGKPLGYSDFELALTKSDRPTIDSLKRSLSLRNLRNLGADGVALIIDTDLSAMDADDTDLAGLMAQGESDCSKYICAIPTSCLLDRHDLVEHTLTLRAAGFGIALNGFGMGPWDTACMQAARPDIVAIDPAWFQRVASNAPAARLLSSLVAGLHDQGADVLIDGINSQAELRIAVDCGADLLQGDALGQAALAGSSFDPARRPLKGLLEDGANVVPLFA